MKKLFFILISIFVFIPFFSVCAEGEQTKILLPAYVSQGSTQKWGYINDSGEFVIEPTYDDVFVFNTKGFAFVSNRLNSYNYYNNNKAYVINNEGKVVLGPYEGNIKDFNDGYGIVSDKNKGNIVISEEGKVLFTTQYAISSISDGMVMFYEKGNYEKIGYMDISGKIIVPLKYKMSSSDYKNGIAHVTIDGEKYFYIDKSGKVTKNENDQSISDNNSGLFSFKDEKSGKYGYKGQNGTIAIKPIYNEVQEFSGERAIVTIDLGNYNTKTGVINTKGNYIIKPEHISINSLGQGLFAVNEKGYSNYDYMFYPNAIFDSDGKQLSDYLYYGLGSYNGEYACGCSDTQTFFIDKSGKIAENLPVIMGIGSLRQIGDVFEYKDLDILAYYKKDSTLIWSSNSQVDLGSGIKVIKNKFRPNYYIYIEYPSITGLSDSKMQDKINKKLEGLILGNKDIYTKKDSKEEDGWEAGSTQEDTYTADKNKDLVIFHVNDYMYPIGAAHGMYGVTDYHLNIKTGEIYNLKDLFVKNSKYKERLTSIVRNRIKLENRISEEDFASGGISETAIVTDDTTFNVTENGLEIYFQPYEVACYARGIVSYEIPYGQLIDIIDTKGSFWTSFNKKVLKTKINNLTYIEDAISKQIQNQIKSYEITLISAINTNNFKKVEPVLYKGSSIYNDQKNLVLKLSKKGIKEKLNSYEIYAIGYIEQNDEYKVYVIENIGIMYPPKKTYTSSKYNWCYTLKYEKESKNLKLTKISKW